jgi:hypothetical protein
VGLSCQENESLRTLLRCSEYDAEQQSALELENFRLQLLLAKEQAEKGDAVKKHRLLLEMFRYVVLPGGAVAPCRHVP